MPIQVLKRLANQVSQTVVWCSLGRQMKRRSQNTAAQLAQM